MLSPIEYIDLEKNNFALKAFIASLQFAFEHNETIINKIEKPQIWKESEQLVLDYNAICQLNIVENIEKKLLNRKIRHHSLLSVIKNTSTSMGYRLLKQTLLEPIYNSEKLKLSYNQIEEIMVSKDSISFYEQFLKEIPDIERFHRKLHLQKLQPYEFSTLINSYFVIVELLETFTKPTISENSKFSNNKQPYLSKLVPQNKDIEKFKEFLVELSSKFNLKELDGTNLTVPITNNIFKVSVFRKIDKLSKKIKDTHKFFKTLQDTFSTMINIPGSIKLIKTAREGTYLTTTPKRFQMLQKKLRKKDLIIKTSNKFRTTEMDQRCDELEELLNLFNSETKKCYNDLLIKFSNDYSETLMIISNFVI